MNYPPNLILWLNVTKTTENYKEIKHVFFVFAVSELRGLKLSRQVIWNSAFKRVFTEDIRSADKIARIQAFSFTTKLVPNL